MTLGNLPGSCRRLQHYCLFGVLAGLLGAVTLLIKKLPLFALDILWFFAAHSLESTILPLELVHEHRNYLASFGILLALVVLLAHLLSARQKIFGVLSVCLVLAFSIVLYQRSSIWSNDFTHAEYEARNKPNSPNAVFELGQRYYVAAMQGVEGADKLAYPLIESRMFLDCLMLPLIRGTITCRPLLRFITQSLQKIIIKLSRGSKKRFETKHLIGLTI